MRGHPKCFRCGHCCLTAPCRFGDGVPCGSLSFSISGEACCGRYEELLRLPRETYSPFFTGRCSSDSANVRRLSRLRQWTVDLRAEAERTRGVSRSLRAMAVEARSPRAAGA